MLGPPSTFGAIVRAGRFLGLGMAWPRSNTVTTAFPVTAFCAMLLAASPVTAAVVEPS